jgi:transketolase
MLPVAYDYAQELKKDGINPTIISMHSIKPIDKDCILQLINNGNKIYTFEEHTIIGGLGSAVAEIIAESGKAVQFKRIGINDEYSHIVGSTQYIREQFKLDLKGVKEQCC